MSARICRPKALERRARRPPGGGAAFRSRCRAPHVVALVGPNGAGKTTLLRALAGLLPAHGAVHVDGARGRIARRCASARGASPICRRATTCTGRCRCATSWRSGAIRTARPIRRGCRPTTARRSSARWRRPTSTAFADRPVTELVRRRAQPRRCWRASLAVASAGDPGRRADRVARSAPPDRGHAPAARRRRRARW